MRIQQKIALAGRLVKHKVRRQRLRHLTIEVTKRCNARCGFCTYWYEPQGVELEDFAPIVQYYDPLVVTISGGEPLLRTDLVEIIEKIRRVDSHAYMVIVTHGALISLRKARRLSEAGVNQLSISLDYASDKHDEVRRLPGVFNKITTLLPDLVTLGFDSVNLNTVIRDDNLDDIPGLLEIARRAGIKIGFSSYCKLKTDADDMMVGHENEEKLKNVIDIILRYREEHRIVRNSEYYLRRIPEYFTNGGIGGCQAGRSHIHVTPAGKVKVCSEMPIVSDYSAYDPNRAPEIACTSCWYSCRGESQAPVNLQRIRELW